MDPDNKKILDVMNVINILRIGENDEYGNDEVMNMNM